MEEEIEEEKPSIWYRVIILLMGLFLIFLMISWTFVTYPIGNILEGMLVSEKSVDNTLSFGNITLSFEGNTMDKLKQTYLNNQEKEFSVCLIGNGNEIASLYQPKTYSSSFNHVTSEPCSEDTLIMLHSHPYKSCIPSQTDLNTLKKAQERNPKLLMIVMCEPNRFNVVK
tara:strand:+ start:71 stop:580 length:510 start_codon:yes stop_codon:yes gene_type:complete